MLYKSRKRDQASVKQMASADVQLFEYSTANDDRTNQGCCYRVLISMHVNTTSCEAISCKNGLDND